MGLKEFEGEKGRREKEAKMGGVRWIIRSADLTLKWRGNDGYCGGSMGTQSQTLPDPTISRTLRGLN